jgi:hypothetical protein
MLTVSTNSIASIEESEPRRLGEREAMITQSPHKIQAGNFAYGGIKEMSALEPLPGALGSGFLRVSSTRVHPSPLKPQFPIVCLSGCLDRIRGWARYHC